MQDDVLQSIRAEIKACTTSTALVEIWARVSGQLSESQRIDVCHAICVRYIADGLTHDASGCALVPLINQLAKWP